MYVGHSAASSLSLWHQTECVEGETDGRTDRWKEGRGSLLFISPLLHLFGEFADDTDERSIFVFETLVVGSQVDQDLAVKS